MEESTLKSRLLELYLGLPRPISKRVHALWKGCISPDDRKGHFEKAIAAVAEKKLEGDYLEFGVYHGSSFITAHNLANQYGLTRMRFFAFDSFEGLPNSEGAAMKQSDLSCPEDVFTRMVSQAGVDMDRVVKVPGFYDRSLTPELKARHRLERAAVVHIDCDLYTSTKAALDFVGDLVETGTIVIFDDWYLFRDEDVENLGERKAFREWPLHGRFEPFYDIPDHSKAFACVR